MEGKRTKLVIKSLFGFAIVIYIISVGIAMGKQDIDKKSYTSSSSVATSANTKTTDTINTGINTGVTEEDAPMEVVNIEYCYTYSSSKDYLDVKTTVKNDSNKSIDYVKLDLYFKDGNGNIVYSDWTNCSATIKPNATQVITKTVKITGNWKRVISEISDYSFR